MTNPDPSHVSKTRDPKERVICIKRTARATKGGPRFTFSAVVVFGDSCGRVGIGFAKSSEAADALRKAGASAATATKRVKLFGATIPHDAFGSFCGAKVWLRPAAPGTGMMAGRAVRAVLECVGVKDVLAKSMGAGNPANVAKATLRALATLRAPKRALHLVNADTVILFPIAAVAARKGAPEGN